MQAEKIDDYSSYCRSVSAWTSVAYPDFIGRYCLAFVIRTGPPYELSVDTADTAMMTFPTTDMSAILSSG